MVELTDLPWEILEYISKYIAPDDLARCCAVSTTWRARFNDDLLWKQHSRKRLDDLQTSECQVEPRFKDFKSDGTLPPIGRKRLNYIKYQHLWGNWRSGRFIEHEIEFECDDSISYNIQVDFYKNDYVFIHRTFESQLWHIRDKLLIMSIPFKLVQMWDNYQCKVIDNSLLVVQMNVVQIFNVDIENKTGLFVRALFFDQSEEFSSKVSEECVDAVFQETSISLNEENLSVHITHNCLLGCVEGIDDAHVMHFHIWNWRTGQKISMISCHVDNLLDIRGVLDARTCKTLKIPSFSSVENSKTVNSKLVVNHMPDSNNGQVSSNQAIAMQDIASVWGQRNDELILFYCNLKKGSLLHAITMPLLPGLCCKLKNCIEENGMILMVEDNKVCILDLNSPGLEPLIECNETIDYIDMLVPGKFLFTSCSNTGEIWQLGDTSKSILKLESEFQNYETINESYTTIVLEEGNKVKFLIFW